MGAPVSRHSRCSVNKQKLFTYFREHLAPHRTPKQWFQVEQFPLTGSGKIQKFVLRDQWANGEVTELWSDSRSGLASVMIDRVRTSFCLLL